MANNVINTRIQLKVDTLTNWQTNNPVLLDGEIAIAKIDIVDPANKHLQPAMIKVGDGTSTFNQLDWTSAKAADVYEWAKASTKPEYNFEELKNIPDFITPNELENYYTKDEINTKLSSVYKYKGSVDYYFDLPKEKEVGDVYNIRNASGEQYIEEDIRYYNYTVEDVSGIPPFTDYDLDGIDIIVRGMSDKDFENLEAQGDTVKLDIDADFSFDNLPITLPSRAINCVWREGNVTHIWFVVGEGPFQDQGYYETVKGYLQNVNPYLQFNNAKIKYRKEPYIVKDGDNVAWTGTEWDVLAGTFEIDLSDYVTNDNVVNSVNGKKGNITLTTQDLYEHFIIDENTGLSLTDTDGIRNFEITGSGILYETYNTDLANLKINNEGLIITNEDPSYFVDIVLKDQRYVDRGQPDLGMYYEIHKLTEKANTADLATIATSGNIYDISNAGAVQTSAGTDDTGEKYIVFNCGSSTTVI